MKFLNFLAQKNLSAARTSSIISIQSSEGVDFTSVIETNHNDHGRLFIREYCNSVCSVDNDNTNTILDLCSAILLLLTASTSVAKFT
jgi:hypothetical protein